MKLILAIISEDDTKPVISALNKESFQVTKLSTSGGFLSMGNTTIMIGCADELVEKAISIIGSESEKRTEIVPTAGTIDMNAITSIPVEVQVGGATIFVLNVEDFRKL